MNKKGFAIIETIIVVVSLTTILIMLYKTYSGYVNQEEQKIYYDDIVDIYRTNNIKRYLENYSNMGSFVSSYFEQNNNHLIVAIGSDSSGLFDDEEHKEYFSAMYQFYNTSQLIILKTDFDIISDCTLTSRFDTDISSAACNTSFKNLDANLFKFIKTLGSDITLTNNSFILIGVYTDDNNKVHYSYIDLNVIKGGV